LSSRPAVEATAVLLGDHPALTAGELNYCLAAAALCHSPGTHDRPASAAPPVACGVDSRVARPAAGYVDLDGDWPELRRDVGIDADFDGFELGPRTRQALGL
jgi:hypothetical protein